MSDGTKIEWTDATANVINGCSLESPGCTNCYAMKQAHRFPVRQGLTMKTKGGMVWTGEVRFHEPALLKVLSWRKPRMIFWNAHGDMFHPDVPDEWIDRCFAAMALTPQHIHQVLTKRSARMREYVSAIVDCFHASPEANEDRFVPIVGDLILSDHGEAQEAVERFNFPLPNVWLGVSVEDQARADERIPDLLATPAAVRWLSCEPLLGPVDLRHVKCAVEDITEQNDWVFDALTTGSLAEYWDGSHWMDGDGPERDTALDWIVAGGESGPGARPMHPAWARSPRDQCAAAGVPFFFKQVGAWGDPFESDAVGTHWLSIEGKLTVAHQALPAPTDVPVVNVGKKRAGRLLDGVTHDAMPEVL